MRKIILAGAILIAGLTVGACGSNSSTPSVPQTPATAAQAPSGDQAFLGAIDGQGNFGNLSQSDLIGLAKAACSDFDNGYTAEQVAQDAVDAVNNNPSLGLGYKDIGIIVGAGVVTYCPQYTAPLQAWVNTVGQ